MKKNGWGTIFLVFGGLIAGMIGFFVIFSNINRMPMTVNGINNKENKGEELVLLCQTYRGYLQPSDLPDPNAAERCAVDLGKKDAETILFFCTRFTEGSGKIARDACLEAAEEVIQPALASGDFTAAAEQYLKIAQDALPFLPKDQASTRAEQIRHKTDFEASMGLLETARTAFQKSKYDDAQDQAEKFWKRVGDAGIEGLTQAQVTQTAEAWFTTMAANFEDGNYQITEPQLRTIQLFVSQSAPDHPVRQTYQRHMLELIELGASKIRSRAYLRGLRLLKSIQGMSADEAFQQQSSKALEAAYDAIAVAEDGELKEALFYLRGNYCFTQNNLGDLAPALGRTASGGGRLENCIKEVNLPEGLLANTLGDLKYRAEMEEIGTNKTFLMDCQYSGGHVVHQYAVDYRVTILDIQTGRIAAETILAATESSCSPGAIFPKDAKEMNTNEPPPDDQITAWLWKAIARLP